MNFSKDIEEILEYVSSMIAVNHTENRKKGYMELRKFDDEKVEEATQSILDILDKARVETVEQIKSDIEDCGRPFTPLQDALDTVALDVDGMETTEDNTINQRMVLEYLEERLKELGGKDGSKRTISN